jgi:regulator of protease activity HflC (stomatin/prohibitin superfamily)
VAVTYAITKEGAMEVYRRFGDDDAIGTNVVIPNIKEAVRSVIANYKATDLITKRPEVSSLIHERLQNKLNEFGLSVSDTNIQDVSFSAQFQQSIESKVKAEQDALAKKNELDKTKYEAEQTVVRAKAEAETIRIQAEAVKSQ